MIRVTIASPQELVPFDRARLRGVVRTVLAEEGQDEAEISLALVDDSTSQRLNRQFLGHDSPTDVLSFPLSKGQSGKLVGELVIGAETALREAQERGHDVQAEQALYIIHGLLHLCQYDDGTLSEEKRMREGERHYLKKLGLPDISPHPK